jgi:hypothetical protein
VVVFAIADQQGAGGGCVVEGFAVEGEVVVGDGGFFGWDGRRGLGFVARVGGVGFIGAAGLLLGAKGGQGADEDKRGEGKYAKKGAGRKDAGTAWRLAQGDLRRDSKMRLI